MVPTIEVAGVDVKAATASGLESLGLNRDAVEVEVLDEGNRGVFGLGARDARVRLTVTPSFVPVETEEAVPLAADESPIEDAEAAEQQAEIGLAQEAMLELLAMMGFDGAQVSVERAEPAPGERNPPVLVRVNGPGTDVLIGRRGETLAALQHVTRLIVGREVMGKSRLVVDVGGHKARREKTLRQLAQRLAEQAMNTDRTVLLEPMPPHERRIVHIALRDHAHVVTESIGEGNRRKVTIIPRRQ